MILVSQPCPCGRRGAAAAPRGVKAFWKSGQGAPVLGYAECCGRWHSGPEALAAPDAESLMRSRYSAYVLGLADYLLQTWAPQTRPAAIEPDEPGLQWLGLEIKASRDIDADHATVSFVARSKLGGRARRMQECSRFIRGGDGRWLYLDGDFG